VSPLRFPDKQEAKEISWKLWQASGVTANVCYLSQYNPYGTDLKEYLNLVVDSALHLHLTINMSSAVILRVSPFHVQSSEILTIDGLLSLCGY